MLRLIYCFSAVLLCVARPAGADTILTFDIPGFLNFEAVDQGYGDRVSSTTDAIGSYGILGTGFTPNVLVEYGTADEDPSLWHSGYGNLTNVLFNDQDGNTTFTTLFTADPGYLVTLVSFDIASYLGRVRTINGARAVDALTNDVIWSIDPTQISGPTALSLMPNVSASQIALIIDLTGLGTVSDDIAIDNIRFAQTTAPMPVPEPASLSLLGCGLLTVAAQWIRVRRRRGSSARSHEPDWRPPVARG